MSRKAYLILENGTVFEGKSFGAEKETMGELVFTTAMTGYLETLTDPSYFGQVVIQTFPLIGNYGVIPSDFESKVPSLRGYIVREWCQAPSNFRCEGDLDTFLKESDIPGIYGLDTRALTRIVREYGVLNCKIAYSGEVTEEELAEIGLPYDGESWYGLDYEDALSTMKMLMEVGYKVPQYAIDCLEEEANERS